jgi:hypothetical protein
MAAWVTVAGRCFVTNINEILRHGDQNSTKICGLMSTECTTNNIFHEH